MAGKFDFSKVPFADGFEESVVPDVRLFVSDGRHRVAAAWETVSTRWFRGWCWCVRVAIDRRVLRDQRKGGQFKLHVNKQKQKCKKFSQNFDI